MFGSGAERKKEWAAFETEAMPWMADVFRTAMWLAHDHAVAEDLTQETFVQALESFHRYTARNQLPRLADNDSLSFEQQAAAQIGQVETRRRCGGTNRPNRRVRAADSRTSDRRRDFAGTRRTAGTISRRRSVDRCRRIFLQGSRRTFANADWNGNVAAASRSPSASAAFDGTRPQIRDCRRRLRVKIMRCQEFREILDSYLGDELLIKTNHNVLKHLEDCPACRQESAARRKLRTRLRLAAKNAPDVQLNPAFARRLKNNLRETALRPAFFEKFRCAGFSAIRRFWRRRSAC